MDAGEHMEIEPVSKRRRGLAPGGRVDNPTRQAGLGFFCALSDKFLLRVFLDYFAIGRMECLRALAQTSRLMRVFADWPTMWHRVCISLFRGCFAFTCTWKDSVMFNLTRREAGLSLPSREETEHRIQWLREERGERVPLPVEEMYMREAVSERMYKKWQRVSVPISRWKELPADLPASRRVDRRANLTYEEFRREYAEKKRPVIITDVVGKWPAARRWTMERFIDIYGEHRFRMDEVDGEGDKIYMRYQDYVSYLHSDTGDSDPIYLFDPTFGEHTPQLLADYEVPVYFSEDLLSSLPEEPRPFYRWLVVGPPRSGSPFHTDPYRTAAWNALVCGRKRWALYPGSVVPPGVQRYWDEDDEEWAYRKPNPIKWYLETYEADGGQLKHDPTNGPIECILEPGEVLNLESTIAVTQNFCADHNFVQVYDDLQEDRDIHIMFTEKMLALRPDLMSRVKIPRFFFKKLRKEQRLDALHRQHVEYLDPLLAWNDHAYWRTELPELPMRDFEED